MSSSAGRPTVNQLEEEKAMLWRMLQSGVRKTTSSEGTEVEYRTMADLERAYKRAAEALSDATSFGVQPRRRTRRIIVVGR